MNLFWENDSTFGVDAYDDVLDFKFDTDDSKFLEPLFQGDVESDGEKWGSDRFSVTAEPPQSGNSTLLFLQEEPPPSFGLPPDFLDTLKTDDEQDLVQVQELQLTRSTEETPPAQAATAVEETKGPPSPSESHYLSQTDENRTRILMAKAIGQQGLDYKGHVFETYMKKRKNKPSVQILRREAQSRYEILGLKSQESCPQRPNTAWSRPQLMKWLQKHPITNKLCRRFILHTLRTTVYSLPIQDLSLDDCRQRPSLHSDHNHNSNSKNELGPVIEEPEKKTPPCSQRSQFLRGILTGLLFVFSLRSYRHRQQISSPFSKGCPICYDVEVSRVPDSSTRPIYRRKLRTAKPE